MDNRIEKLRSYVGSLRRGKELSGDFCYEERDILRAANYAPIIALARNLDLELLTIIALLHDVLVYLVGIPENSDKFRSRMAKEILIELDIVSDEEMIVICKALENYSKGYNTCDLYSIVIRDAEVLGRYLYNVSCPVCPDEQRYLNEILYLFTRRQ